MRKGRNILVLLAAGAALSAAVGADTKGKPDPARVPGSKAQQLLLKRALDQVQAGTLVAELNRNKKIWEDMNPQRRQQLRERFYAYLRLDPQQQAEMLKLHEEFSRLTDEQRKSYMELAEWLKKVIGSLTPAQREELKQLTPVERAKRLKELKDKLPGPAGAAGGPITRPAGVEAE